MIGFECTIGVASIDDTAKAVLASGGKVVMDKSVIVGVGTLMFFQDTEGNVFGAMQFDKDGGMIHQFTNSPTTAFDF